MYIGMNNTYEMNIFPPIKSLKEIYKWIMSTIKMIR